jgi:glutathione synthase
MKHIFFIDKISQLNLKKDSSLFMALSLKEKKQEVYLLFEENFYIRNDQEDFSLKVYNFDGNIGDDFYIKSFNLLESEVVLVNPVDIIHFRADPPVNERYISKLWLLDSLVERNICLVKNAPRGILQFNEKILGLNTKNALPTIVSSDLVEVLKFCKAQHSNSFIIKPLNSFSGFGVLKIENDAKLQENIEKTLKETMIVQPFVEKIYQGEVRAIYFAGIELGSIIKYPPAKSFLSNIAQGASFEKIELKSFVHENCQKISLELKEQGIDLVAFDILDDKISEVNITCPGLLVELSHAHNKNLSPF